LIQRIRYIIIKGTMTCSGNDHFFHSSVIGPGEHPCLCGRVLATAIRTDDRDLRFVFEFRDAGTGLETDISATVLGDTNPLQ
jgi:hypothetical protein